MIDHDRVSRLFLAASALTPEAIPLFLDRECAGDAELRAEIEAMLVQDVRQGATGALAARVLGAARAMPASALPAASGVPMPERIGPYRILELLGEGGMGVVYRAEQTDPIHREVALKVIRGGADSAGVLARFEAERQMIASMDHPNIARVLDAGSDAEGRPYFVMERIEGVPITDYCRSRNLPVRERLSLFLEVCRGVRHAHRRGVIHRDLKPSNVLVTEAGGTAVPKVIDFSIAKALGAPALMTEFRTRTGQIVGTLEYMSPEQATGRVDTVDTRSDVYALGVVLYELMTGRLPHDLRGLSLHEAVKQIAEEPARSLRGTKTTVMGRLDSDLETIIGRCLEKEPDRRYESAAELTEDLERYLRSRPILARRPSALYQLRKLIGRHRVTFGVAALLFAFLVVFSVTVTVQLSIQRRERTRADAQARKADRVALFMQDALQGSLKDLGREATVMSALEHALKDLTQRPTDDPEADAAIRVLVANAYGLINERDTAQRLNREAVVLLERRFGPRHPAVADALQSLGVSLYYDGKLDEAASLVRRVFDFHEAQNPLDGEALASDLSLLGSIEKQRRHLGAAEAAFRREITLREPRYALIVKHNLANVLLLGGRIGEGRRILEEVLALEISDGDAAMVAFDRASLACAQGKHVDAEPRFREAVERERRLLGVHDRLLVGHGRCLGHLRRFAEAETVLREAVALQRERSLDGRLPLDVRADGELATLLLEQHLPLEAEPLALEALEADRKQFGDDSFPVAADRARLAAVAEASGDWKAAEEAHRRSLTMRERLLAPDDVDVGHALCGLAGFLSRRGRFIEAAPFHVRGLAILEKRFDVPTQALATSKEEWAVTLDGLERYAEGDDARADALRLMRGTVGDDHPSVARLLHDRAASLRRRRRLDEASSVIRDAVARRRRLLGAKDPDLAASLLEMARIQSGREALGEAHAAAREALAIWAKAEFVDPAALLAARQLSGVALRVAGGRAETHSRR